MSKFRDPEAVAEEIAESAAEAGAGVLRDTLVEARMEADSAHQILNEMCVELDSICDDRGLFPGSVASDLRQRQTQLREAAEWMERFANALDSEFEERVEVSDA